MNDYSYFQLVHSSSYPSNSNLIILSDAHRLVELAELTRELLHIMLYLLVGYAGIDLCVFNVGMPQHLRYTLHRNALTQRHRSKCMAGKMENIIHLRNWKNIENKPVTGCELVDFLYFASVAEKQSDMEY